jgi:hypothetical protein
MTPLRPTLIALGCALTSLPALAGQTFSESFTGGSNAAGWTYGPPNQVIETSGGNPGAFLHEPAVDTFAPQPRSGDGVASMFTGDYRARRVLSVGVDLITFSTQFAASRNLTLMLGNDNGTPGDPSDDCFVYWIGAELVPQPGAGWKSFEFAVPSQSTVLPAGWSTSGTCAAPDAAWNHVITGVTNVRFFYGDPTFFYIFDIWNAGLDNPRITVELGTAYCFGDGSGTPCPCANNSAAPTGCKNSTGSGAALDASGSAGVAADELALTATWMPPNVSVFLFQGTAQVNGGAGAVLGDGLRCAGGTLKRFPAQSANGSGAATWGPGLSAFGGWTAGTTLNFQAWYRNNGGPCGSGYNLSSARSITFAP